MPNQEFENWLDIDNNAEVAAAMTVFVIRQAVADDKSKFADDKLKLAEESKSNCTSKEEEILEAPPTNVQMQEALRILRHGVQYRATNFQRHYEYEQFIHELLNANKQQATLRKFLK
jgi:hypothetical protein